MQWQREKADSGVHGSLRPGAKQSAAADCIGLEHHPPAVFPCSLPLPLFFFLFISSLDHSPPRPSPPPPLSCYSLFLLFLPTLSNCRSDVPPSPYLSFSFSLSLCLSSNGGQERLWKKSSPRASFCLPHLVRRRNRGEGVEGKRSVAIPFFSSSPFAPC